MLLGAHFNPHSCLIHMWKTLALFLRWEHLQMEAFATECYTKARKSAHFLSGGPHNPLTEPKYLGLFFSWSVKSWSNYPDRLTTATQKRASSTSQENNRLPRSRFQSVFSHIVEPLISVACVYAGKGSEIGDYLTTHPKVNCVSFTGGDTGISICKKGGMTPYQMELGGKDACIVCADADVDLAAKNIVKVCRGRMF